MIEMLKPKKTIKQKIGLMTFSKKLLVTTLILVMVSSALDVVSTYQRSINPPNGIAILQYIHMIFLFCCPFTMAFLTLNKYSYKFKGIPKNNFIVKILSMLTLSPCFILIVCRFLVSLGNWGLIA